MRALWLNLVPLLAAAALVLWGGERLARRTVEDRIPADRDRLFDFTEGLRAELDRLDVLYSDHLTEIAAASSWLSPGLLENRCENLVGLRSLSIFVDGRKESEFSGKMPLFEAAGRIPSVVAEGEGGRVVSRNSVVLPKELLEGVTSGSGWLSGPESGHRVRWTRPQPGRVAAFVIDEHELGQALKGHFDNWLESPLAPLREAGELVAIEGPGEKEWFTPPQDMRSGPAAMVLPHRTGLGEWQVLAWDKLKTSATHDNATLLLTYGIAGILLISGIFLQIQQRRALRLAEERVSFVNRVSHELGSPLTNILLNLDLSLRALDERPAESRRRLSLVNEEVQRLARLVSNVLTFSRGERKTLELRPAACIPDDVVEGVLDQFQPSLERRKVTVEWQRGAASGTLLDPDALAQITGNLISNVEKYASTGGWLGLETRMENGRFQLRVRDRGPGIPPRQKERIFEAFERVHRGVSEGSSGTGLGLSIARDLARRMGGDLVLESSENGAAFELDLPAPPHLAVVADEPAA